MVDRLPDRLAHLVDSRFKGNWAEAARAAGLSPTSMQKIKEGADPRATTLVRIARGWGVTVDSLLFDELGVVRERPAEYEMADDAKKLARYREATAAVVGEVSAAGLRLDGRQITGMIDFALRTGLRDREIRELVSLFRLQTNGAG